MCRGQRSPLGTSEGFSAPKRLKDVQEGPTTSKEVQGGPRRSTSSPEILNCAEAKEGTRAGQAPDGLLTFDPAGGKQTGHQRQVGDGGMRSGPLGWPMELLASRGNHGTEVGVWRGGLGVQPIKQQTLPVALNLNPLRYLTFALFPCSSEPSAAATAFVKLST